jgi:hypothetical protein
MNPCEFDGIFTTFAPIPRFSVGDRVRVAMRFPLGRYRTTIYVRGKVGCISPDIASAAWKERSFAD